MQQTGSNIAVFSVEEGRLSRSACGEKELLAVCTSIALTELIAHLAAGEAVITSVMSAMALFIYPRIIIVKRGESERNQQ